ncbi:MAG: PEP-CTERM system TPR-repeat protein PrsT [Burkholderiaceae bacterium]|nr:PEP-CTERM system TPR-repeat protein PrsT [Burkholderiaceae bacterium]
MTVALRAGKTLLLSMLVILTACGGSSEKELLASASSYLAKNDTAAATIELKNLLQKDPKSAAGRFMLGKVLFQTGNAAGAEIELRRALEAGHPRDEVLPLLAAVMVAQKSFAPLLQQFGKEELKDGAAAAELHTQLAIAHRAGHQAGKLPEAAKAADAAIESALKRAPGYPPAIMLKARFAAAQGDSAAALTLIDALLAAKPAHALAWGFKGDLLAQAVPVDAAAAMAAYREALRLQPDLAQAHAALLSLLLEQRDFEAADTQFAALKKVLPQHPQTLYFEAAQALRKDDAKRTREITEALLRSSPQNPHVLMLAGQAEAKLKAMPQAEALLVRAVQAAPKALPPRSLLAQLYLGSGQADKALATLKPLLGAEESSDAGLLVLQGRAQLMSGDAQAAEASFSRAAKLKPDDKRIQASAAMARLGQGQGSAAIGELESIAKSDEGTSADLALISERMRKREFDAALKAVDALAAKRPKHALPDLLRGRIALLRQDLAAARKNFELSLTKDAHYFPAILGLASLDVGEGKPEAARARLEAALQHDAGNVQAQMALAELTARSGGSQEEVIARLNAAIKAQPSAVAPRIALIDLYASAGDTKSALAAAQGAVAAVPNNLELMDRLGRVQQLAGDMHQAVSTFNKMAALEPKSPRPQLRLAEAHLAAKDRDAAGASVRRAMELAPTNLDVQRAGIALALREKQPAQALAIARRVQAQLPDAVLGYVLEAEIELSQQKHDAAAAAFRKAMSKPASADLAPRLHLALLSAKKTAEAQQMAEAWLKSHPDDARFTLHLGDTALGQGQLVLAETRYREVLRLMPDNVLALNNLAYLLVKQGKPGAVPLAEKAVKLAPDRAALMDTLALSYADAKDLSKALALQTKVVALAPDVPDYRLGLARMQVQSGNAAAARTELKKLSALGKDYPRQEEVAQLLKTLGS